MSSNSNSTNRRFFQDTEPVWDETNEKNRRQYETVFTIMIVLAVAMFIAIGLGLFELIREVTEPDKTAIESYPLGGSIIQDQQETWNRTKPW